MKALLLTNEFPPNIYGGAGVHVDYLSQELAKLLNVEVRCFGEQKSDDPKLAVQGFSLDAADFTSPASLKSVFGAIRRCTDFNTMNIDADVVHCHTWYSHFGGILAKLCYGLPLVVTIHSLEPLRPWKREQLGHGYDFSLWLERTTIEMADAIVAVSEETKRDVLDLFDVDESKIRIIYNGIQPDQYHPQQPTDALAKFGIDPARPYLLFVGRIARQKGIVHLVNAIKYLDPGFQIVLCAGAPDTPEIAAEMKAAVAAAQAVRSEIFWIEDMVSKPEAIQLYANAAVFCCPSIYEPFGIINLEAMACETAVVASAVGGIKEVVVHGETGYLVPLEQMTSSPFEPVNPDQFARDLAAPINELMKDPDKRERMGKAGRLRALEKFSWSAIAAQTRDLYAELLT
ncbi:MAG TPA: glycogen synthase [Chthoniobacterales bacterium]|jgi:glycogen synthase